MNAVPQRIRMSLAVFGIFTLYAGAQAYKPASGNINVTTVVFDDDTGGTQLLMRSDDYNGAGQATYSGALNAGVSSYIDSSGVWRFDLYGQRHGVRTLWLTPDDAINSSQPPGQPPGYYWENVEVYSACRDQNLNIVPFQNILTASNNCSLGVDFNSGGTVYKLIMSPQLPAPGPATGLATVTCNSVSGGQCVNWTIVPNLTAPNATVANLYSYTGGRTSPWVFIGQYYNTFRFNVTNP